MSGRSRSALDGRFAVLVALFAVVVTQVPYEVNRWNVPEGKVFTESLTFQADYSIYFSYVRQAAEGRWWFENRVTPEPHEPIFVNLLWLAMGRLQAALDLSLPLLFHVWRVLGALAITLGFAFAASIYLGDRPRRWLAILVFTTGGGLGWIFQTLAKLGLPHAAGGWWLGLHAPADTFAAIHPWMQIFLFPFHACSGGLWVATLATYALAERRESNAGRLLAGIGIAVLGVVRPHEMTAAAAAVGLYALFRAREDGLVSRATLARVWILVIPLPVVAYLAYVVGVHPIFKTMHAQNWLPPLVPMDLLLTLGPLAAVAAWKGPMLARRMSGDPACAFLAAWVTAVFTLFYAFPFFRYSLEYGNLLVAPLALVAFLPPESAAATARGIGPRLPEGPATRRVFGPRALDPLARLGAPAVALLLVLNAGTSAWLLASKSREHVRPGSQAFLDRGIYEAATFLDDAALPSDVVLSLPGVGHWILRYGGNKVFIASPVSTLGYGTKRVMIRAFYDGATSAEVKAEFLRMTGARWVFVGPAERALGFDPAAMPGLRLAHAAHGVEIHAVEGAS